MSGSDHGLDEDKVEIGEAVALGESDDVVAWLQGDCGVRHRPTAGVAPAAGRRVGDRACGRAVDGELVGCRGVQPIGVTDAEDISAGGSACTCWNTTELSGLLMLPT